MFAFARRFASGPERMKNPSSSASSRPPFANRRASASFASCAAFFWRWSSSASRFFARFSRFFAGPTFLIDLIALSFPRRLL